MKIVAYSCLHYGREYLAYAIRSVIDYVDEYVVLYTPQGSYGHRTDIPCPETRDELYAIAQAAAGYKLRWYDGNWTNEGAHRMTIHEVALEADVLIVLDADEVWRSDLIESMLNLTMPKENSFIGGQSRRAIKIPVMSFWRSFYRAMPSEADLPNRIIYPKIPHGETVLSSSLPIAHFGYAQRPEIVQYKWLIHGHKNELRRDCNWFRDKFLANAQEDVFPAGIGRWYPEAVNPLDYMPLWMKEHPYYGMAVIE